MPEEPADLILYYYSSDERSEEIAEIVSGDYGFLPNDAGGGIINTDEYTAYSYLPFEVRKENEEALEECVKDLQENFPDMEVWIEDNYQKDGGKAIEFHYEIYISSTREEVENNTGGSLSESDTPRGRKKR
jgi:hypothetical protein